MTTTLHRRLAALEAVAAIADELPTITCAELEALPAVERTAAYRRVLRGELRVDVPPLRLPWSRAEIHAMSPAERARAYRALRDHGA